jgi:hypothetical protein
MFFLPLADNGSHATPVASPHHSHQPPSNDTAFPGGQLRHSYNLHQQQQQQQQQQGHLLNLAQHPAKPKPHIPKNSQVKILFRIRTVILFCLQETYRG